MAAHTKYDRIEMLKLPDCGGLLDNGRCKWLNVPACIGAGCSYAGRSSASCARRRLRSLDETTQSHIADKYYGGARPWLEDQ